VKLIRFFGRYLRHYAAWAALAAIAVAFYGLSSVGMVALIEPIFDEVLLAGSNCPPGMQAIAGPDVEDDAEVASRPFGSLNLKSLADKAYEGAKHAFGITTDNVYWFTPLLLLVIFLVRGLANFVSGYSFQRIGLGVTTDIRNSIYMRLLEQSSRFHTRHTSGELISRLVADVTVLQSAVSSRMLDMVQQSVTLVLLLGLLISTNLQLALICLAAAPALLYTIVRFGRGMRRFTHRSQERLGEVTSLLSEGVRGHRVVKAFGMEEFEHGRFKEATGRHLRIGLRAQLLSNLSSPVLEALVALGSAAFLLYAGLKIRAGELTAPLLVQFMANLMLLYDPIRKLNKVNLQLQQALAAAHRLADLLAIPNEIRDRLGARTIRSVERTVTFEDVSFGYANVPVLQSVSLKIPRGETVALVGPSGAGKSTLVSLLPRFFDPDGGRVAIDGTDIRDITLKSLRAQIGIVTQETILFNDTVRNNIAYGREDMPLEHVREAARAAYADDFVMEMEHGYDTVVGEMGQSLSGGQRQRVAIARAILKNAPILILDEATSALDSESESLVQKALHNLMQGKTTLVIAHRLSTVIEADRIVVLEGGAIVEQGTHQQLLGRGGTYKRLADLQFSSNSQIGEASATPRGEPAG
jgi:subfamily B ATP-binding cassette protein MsbA